MGVAVARRLEFEPGGFGSDLLPELSWVGFNVWTRRRPQNLGPHAHAGDWEIALLVRGRLEEVVAGETHLWREGELMVFAPGVEHSGVDRVAHRCELAWLGVDLADQLPGIDEGVLATVRATFAGIRPVPYPAEAGVLEAFAGLLREGRDRRPLAAPICRSYLHRIVLGAARSWEARAPQLARRSRQVDQALALMRERLAAPLRVEALARAVGLGRSSLHERFVAETGLSPAEHLAHLRIERAKELLPDSTNAAVALALGFASPQHFATAFKRATGLTPGSWRGRERAR